MCSSTDTTRSRNRTSIKQLTNSVKFANIFSTWDDFKTTFLLPQTMSPVVRYALTEGLLFRVQVGQKKKRIVYSWLFRETILRSPNIVVFTLQKQNRTQRISLSSKLYKSVHAATYLLEWKINFFLWSRNTDYTPQLLTGLRSHCCEGTVSKAVPLSMLKFKKCRRVTRWRHWPNAQSVQHIHKRIPQYGWMYIRKGLCFRVRRGSRFDKVSRDGIRSVRWSYINFLGDHERQS